MKPESESRQREWFFDSNTSKDPFDFYSVFLYSLRSLGFPIKFEEGAESEHGEVLESDLRVMVDSLSTTHRINEIWMMFIKHRITPILDSVSSADLSSIMSLLREKDEAFGKEVLEKCFLRAYQRLADKKSGPKIITEEQRKLAEKLKKKGVQPIEHQEMRQIVISAIKELKSPNP